MAEAAATAALMLGEMQASSLISEVSARALAILRPSLDLGCGRNDGEPPGLPVDDTNDPLADPLPSSSQKLNAWGAAELNAAVTEGFLSSKSRRYP